MMTWGETVAFGHDIPLSSSLPIHFKDDPLKATLPQIASSVGQRTSAGMVI